MMSLDIHAITSLRRHAVTRRRWKLRRPASLRYPTLIENGYAKTLTSLVDLWRQATEITLIPLIENIVREAALVQGNQTRMDAASWSDDVTLVTDRAKGLFFQISAPMATVAETVAGRINTTNARTWQRSMTQAVGTPLFQIEPGLDAMLKAFVNENVGLIKNLSEDTAKQIAEQIYNGVRDGRTSKQIANAILRKTDLDKGTFNKIRTRADFIARDQVGKLNGQITRMRQTNLGLTRYVWRTMRDEKVRLEHARREGIVFDWNKPPIGGHPGEDYGCRCYPEPMFSDILPDLENVLT